MTTPSVGPLYFSHLNDELKRPSGQLIDLNDQAVRKLAGKLTGTVYMSDLLGKSANADEVTITPGVWSSATGYLKDGTTRYGSTTKTSFVNTLFPGLTISDYQIVSTYIYAPDFGLAYNLVQFRIVAPSYPLGVWNTMKIGTFTFNKADAVMSNSGNERVWTWSTEPNDLVFGSLTTPQPRVVIWNV